MWASFEFLVRVTLEGFEGWQCMHESSASRPALTLHMLFLVIVSICLINVRLPQLPLFLPRDRVPAFAPRVSRSC